MDDLLEELINVEWDIKIEKSISPKEGNQVSLVWDQGFKFKRSFEKNPIEKNAPKYHPKEVANPSL